MTILLFLLAALLAPGVSYGQQEVSLLFNPGPQEPCHRWPVAGSGKSVTGTCQYVVLSEPDWYRERRPDEGFHRGTIAMGVRGKGQPDPEKLRELNTFHYHFLGLSFKPHKFSDFREIEARLDVKLNYYSGPPDYRTLPTAYFTLDTIASFPDGSWRLLGLLLDIPQDAWRPSGPVFWSDGGLTYPKVVRTLRITDYQLRYGVWEPIRIPLKELYQKTFIPPAGYTWADASLAMFEFYFSSRGADGEAETRNADIRGLK